MKNALYRVEIINTTTGSAEIYVAKADDNEEVLTFIKETPHVKFNPATDVMLITPLTTVGYYSGVTMFESVHKYNITDGENDG